MCARDIETKQNGCILFLGVYLEEKCAIEKGRLCTETASIWLCRVVFSMTDRLATFRVAAVTGTPRSEVGRIHGGFSLGCGH